jgi:hypothetical protein
MQEPGVSKIVSVRWNKDASDLEAAAEGHGGPETPELEKVET